jgi:hypothetical protein
MCVAIWHMLNEGEPYTDFGADYFQRHHDPDAETRRLVRHLEALRHKVNLTAAEPWTCREVSTQARRSPPLGDVADRRQANRRGRSLA